MNIPKHYEVKKWLCENVIVGLKIHYYQTGEDRSSTDWELFPQEGKSQRWRASTVEDLVIFSPDWVRLFKVVDEVRKEVEEWKIFEKEEAHDLAEYRRLKEKFKFKGSESLKE